MANIVLINPRFEASYWGLEHALPMLGKKCNLPTACLPLLAALTPDGHRVTIVDENVEPIDYDLVARADIVGLTGMSVQRVRMRGDPRRAQGPGAFTVSAVRGSPLPEDYFRGAGRCDLHRRGGDHLAAIPPEWAEGRHQARYEQLERTDMATVPVPRYDLIDTKNYLFGSVQFSRGCPFQCEFCDIIVTFGRKPGLKPARR